MNPNRKGKRYVVIVGQPRIENWPSGRDPVKEYASSIGNSVFSGFSGVLEFDSCEEAAEEAKRLEDSSNTLWTYEVFDTWTLPSSGPIGTENGPLRLLPIKVLKNYSPRRGGAGVEGLPPPQSRPGGVRLR